jgi:lysine/ornithine N-monooxygenase
MVEIEDVKRKEMRTKMISLRTYPSYSKWMAKHNISPTELFNKAVEELMEKTGDKEEFIQEQKKEKKRFRR